MQIPMEDAQGAPSILDKFDNIIQNNLQFDKDDIVIIIEMKMVNQN